jgi:5-hydroxyisourate hydrolase
MFLTSFTFGQEKDYQLSTHILDISEGVPADNVKVRLEAMDQTSETWKLISEKRTMNNGRINDFLSASKNNNGIYRFTFYTEAYFKSHDIDSFYPYIQVVFEINDKNHYHVPITLSAYGYSTYRGS